jgi:hypothetical protein
MARRRLELDTVDFLVLRAIWVGNVRAFLTNPEQGREFAALVDIPGDALRQPVSAYAAAKALSLPYETARRAVDRLLASNMAVTAEGGLIVPAAVSASRAMLDLVSDYAALTEALIVRLAEIGVAPGAQLSVDAQIDPDPTLGPISSPPTRSGRRHATSHDGLGRP